MSLENFILKSQYENVGDICLKVREICKSRDLDITATNHIEIALTEALNNVIEHSYKEDPEQIIFVTVEDLDDKMTFKIIDTGSSREDLKPRELKINPDDIESLPESGMGLFIIEQIMDETNYYTEGDKNVFTLIKKIEPSVSNGE
ncbi:MAG: ATP-binding protein [Melioribacteraceae bacterium]|nr:ATP-binding protein [Melioribacteraceae bacterium]